MEVKVFNNGGHLPKYMTEGAAGLDIFAKVTEGGSIIIKPGCSELIPTGIHMEIPIGYEAQIRPRSGLALKHQITVLNTPGTVDADYRGDVGVILINHSLVDFSVKNGDRIGQMVFNKIETIKWYVVDSLTTLDTTDRGDGGFGHTGKNN